MDQSRTNEETLQKRETLQLIAADKVEGTSVYDPAGNKLGSIKRVMIDKNAGRVAYAVMSFGGFLGIGDQHHPLPWSLLHYEPRMGGYVINLDKRVLEGAPTVPSSETAFDWDDRRWNQGVHDYYKAPLY